MDLSVKRVMKFNGGGTLKAFCDLAIGESFVVKGLRVVDGKRGLFVSMPRQQGKDARWYDSVEVLSQEMKHQVDRIVLAAYREQEPATDEQP